MAENIDIVRNFIAAWSRLDAAELAGFFAEDGVYHNMPARPVAGRAAVQAFIAGFIKDWSATEWDVLNVVQAGDAGGRRRGVVSVTRPPSRPPPSLASCPYPLLDRSLRVLEKPPLRASPGGSRGPSRKSSFPQRDGLCRPLLGPFAGRDGASSVDPFAGPDSAFASAEAPGVGNISPCCLTRTVADFREHPNTHLE